MKEYCDKAWMLAELERQKASGSVNPRQIIEEAPTELIPAPYWYKSSQRLPETEEKVLCWTRTKAGADNMIVGYYSPELGRWCCGQNSNVVAWLALPTPELLAATYEELIQEREKQK